MTLTFFWCDIVRKSFRTIQASECFLINILRRCTTNAITIRVSIFICQTNAFLLSFWIYLIFPTILTIFQSSVPKLIYWTLVTKLSIKKRFGLRTLLAFPWWYFENSILRTWLALSFTKVEILRMKTLNTSRIVPKHSFVLLTFAFSR